MRIRMMANTGRTKSTVTKVIMAVVLVSPAPLSPPATMNWELWNGCKKATDQHDVPADRMISGLLL